MNLSYMDGMGYIVWAVKHLSEKELPALKIQTPPDQVGWGWSQFHPEWS